MSHRDPNNPSQRPGHTNYDWINGMRVGMLAGALVTVLVGLAFGGPSFVWLLLGMGAGGLMGVKLAHRW